MGGKQGLNVDTHVDVDSSGGFRERRVFNVGTLGMRIAWKEGGGKFGVVISRGSSTPTMLLKAPDKDEWVVQRAHHYQLHTN